MVEAIDVDHVVQLSGVYTKNNGTGPLAVPSPVALDSVIADEEESQSPRCVGRTTSLGSKPVSDEVTVAAWIVDRLFFLLV